jgi:hypothetical protein
MDATTEWHYSKATQKYIPRSVLLSVAPLAYDQTGDVPGTSSNNQTLATTFNDKASSVVKQATILTVFVPTLLAGWTGYIVNVRKFKEKHKMYMAVTKGFEKYYGSGVVLLLQKTLQNKTSTITILARTTEDYAKEVLFAKQSRPMSIL